MPRSNFFKKGKWPSAIISGFSYSIKVIDICSETFLGYIRHV